MELLASAAPQLLPVTIAAGLRQGGYEALHRHPVVSFWVRLSNVVNFVNGVALIISVVGIVRRRLWGWTLARASLVVVIGVGLIGTMIIWVFLFPVLDRFDSPVPASTMKSGMITGPLTLMLVAGVKLFALHKPKIRSQFGNMAEARASGTVAE